MLIISLKYLAGELLVIVYIYYYAFYRHSMSIFICECFYIKGYMFSRGFTKCKASEMGVESVTETQNRDRKIHKKFYNLFYYISTYMCTYILGMS